MVDPESTKTAGPQTSRRRRDRSRGAVLIEAAMVFPLLVLLTFGAIEYGLVFRDELKLTTSARSGARIGTADKNAAGSAVNLDDDYQILQAVYAALGNLSSKVVYVSIYNAGTNANGVPAAACTGPGAASQSSPVGSECDVWAASDLTSSAATIEASAKYVWTSRAIVLDTTSGAEPTYLGVEVRLTHNYITGLFGSSRQITERAVFRFEPIGNTSHGNFITPSTTTTTTTTIAGPTTTAPPTTLPPPTTTTVPPPTTTTTAPPPTTTAAPTTSTSHAPTTSTTHAPTTSTTHAAPTSTTSTTSPPPTTSTTAAAPTTTTSTTINIIPT